MIRFNLIDIFALILYSAIVSTAMTYYQASTARGLFISIVLGMVYMLAYIIIFKMKRG